MLVYQRVYSLDFAPFSISSSLPILAKHQGPPFGVAMPGHLRGEILRNRRKLGIVDAAKDPPCSRRNRLWVSSFNHSLNRFIHIYPNKPIYDFFPVLGYTKSAGNVVSRYFWWCWFMSWLTGGDNWMGNYIQWGCGNLVPGVNGLMKNGTYMQYIWKTIYRICPSRRFASTHGGGFLSICPLSNSQTVSNS